MDTLDGTALAELGLVFERLDDAAVDRAVQKRFGVKFSAAEVGKLGNVGDLVALVRAKA